MKNEAVILKYGFEEDAEFESYFSNVSLEYLLFEFIAYASFILELMFDAHKRKSTRNSQMKKQARCLGTVRWL